MNIVRWYRYFVICSSLAFVFVVKGQCQTLLLSGTVSDSQGTAIVGVSVTDGHTVVKTGGDGNYSLAAHPEARFVYLSVPAGYRVPQHDGVAVFYLPIDNPRSGDTYDFVLAQIADSTSQQVLVVGADPQIMTDADALKWTDEVLLDMDSLLRADYNSWEKTALLLGDIVGDNQGLFPVHISGIEKLGIPFFHLAGNHDVDYFSAGNETSKETYSRYFGPTFYSFTIGRIHFAVLDDVFFLGMPYRYMGYIPEQQLRWLEQDLAGLPEGSTVVVCTHIPLEMNPELSGQQAQNVVVNRMHLYQILKPFRVHYFSGHMHRNVNTITEQGFFHEHAAISGQWWTGTNSSDGTPLGYAIYEVLGDSLRWYFKSVGYPKEHQMRLYGPTQERDSLIVNVWNWDPEWRVEWWLDGKFMGPMERFEGIDEHTLNQNQRLPESWSYVRPSKSAHLFFAKAVRKQGRVEIRVTDRFGNVYDEKLDL